MNRLFVDLGNTRVKWALEQEGELGPMQSAPWSTLAPETCLLTLLQSEALLPEPLDGVWVASVVAPERLQWLQDQVQRHWGLVAQIARTRAQQGGLHCGYARPEQLGVDRWLAMLGARWFSPSQPLCVISCGTAVTIDLVDASGQHLGGVILPGLATMRRSLVRDTGALPWVDQEDVEQGFQQATHAGIAAGTLGALIGAVSYHVDLAQAQTDQQLRCWLTGGDAPRIVAHLPKGSVLKNDLVLQGLAWYAREREESNADG